jgi:hypothetical protein
MDGGRDLPRDPAVAAVMRAISPVLRQLRADFDARLDSLEAIFAERIGGQMQQAAMHLARLIDTERRRAEDAIRDSADAVRQLAATVAAQTHSIPDRLTAQLALLPKPRDGRDAFLSIAAAWVGRVYEPGEIVTHLSGTWQAINRTAEEPGPDAAAWRCLADGLALLEVELDPADRRRHIIAFVQSDGLRREFILDLPIPMHRGAYQSDGVYQLGDEVAFDDSSWRCIVPQASTVPGTSEEWKLVARRGGRGRMGPQGPPGQQGERGEVGPAGQDAPGLADLTARVDRLDAALLGRTS